MDVRGYIDENAAGFFDALRQWLAAAAYLWDELAIAPGEPAAAP